MRVISGKIMDSNREKNKRSQIHQLRGSSEAFAGCTRKLVLIVGGSGFIGGALMYYFKTRQGGSFEVLAPSSKQLSLREPEDIKGYLAKYRPDFIVNCAIPPLDSGRYDYLADFDSLKR